MSRSRFARRVGPGLWLLLFGLVLAATPFLHQDAGSVRDSPAHCAACAASPTALRTESNPRLGFVQLPTAGPVVAEPSPEHDSGFRPHSPGRAPPA